ncbi:hypothetical protein ACS0TY_030052 [Phlomoides rotata]
MNSDLPLLRPYGGASIPSFKDMACDTFLKIVQKCKRKFVIVQVGENEPFVSELLTTLPTTIADLEPHQIHSFYESNESLCDSSKSLCRL